MERAVTSTDAQTWISVVTPFLVALLGVVGTYFGFKAAKLMTTIHILVNSQALQNKRALAVATKALAAVTGKPEDVKAAAAAEIALSDQQEAQTRVDDANGKPV
jgi:hypothetical protein